MAERSLFELDFSEEDLIANRAGTITERQREKVQAYAHQRRQAIGWGLVVFALLIAAGIGFEFLRAGGTLELFQRRQTPFLLIVIAVFFGVMVLSTIFVRITTRPLKAEIVTRIDGIAKVETLAVASRLGTYTVYVVRVGKTVFRFYTPESAAHFRQGGRCRVYVIKVPLQPNPIPLSVERN